MVTLILIIHVAYGGFIHLFVTKTSQAICDYCALYNFSNCGMVYHRDLDNALRNAIAWTAASVFYLLGLAALIYCTLNVL